MWAGASGEERCVESEYGPSSSWESLSTVTVDEWLDHGVRSPVSVVRKINRRRRADKADRLVNEPSP